MWAWAAVASKTISTSSRSSTASIPSALVSIPRPAARCRPGESGTIPLISRTSTASERISFVSRSVPMFPGPTIAAPTFGGAPISGLSADRRPRRRGVDLGTGALGQLEQDLRVADFVADRRVLGRRLLPGDVHRPLRVARLDLEVAGRRDGGDLPSLPEPVHPAEGVEGD